MRTESPPRPLGNLQRLAFLASVMVCLGLPMVSPVKAATFFLTIITLFILNPPVPKKLFVRVLATLLLVGLSLSMVPRLHIEEGHQIFWTRLLPHEPLEDHLSPAIFQVMKKDFLGQYPPSVWCNGQITPNVRCWFKLKELPSRPFAFSSDGILRAPRYSRIVDQIDFRDVQTFRAGFINEVARDPEALDTAFYDWMNNPKDIQRETMPYYVFYEFPFASVGSTLCYSGSLYLEKAGSPLIDLSSGSHTCRAITEDWIGSRLYGLGISLNPKLSMQLRPALKFQIADFVRKWGPALTLFAILFLFFCLRFPPTPVSVGAFGVVAISVFCLFHSYPFRSFGDYLVLSGSGDGNVYEGHARQCIRALLRGDWFSFFRGGEDIYILKPGLSHYTMLDRFLFSDTFWFQGMILILIPITLFIFLRKLTSLPIAFIAMVGFFLAPMTWDYRWKFGTFILSAFVNMSEPLGFLLFLLGLNLYFSQEEALGGIRNKYASGLQVGLLIAFSTFVRPSFALTTLAFLCFVGRQVYLGRKSRHYLFGFMSGLAIDFVMPIHNFYFGGKFVPLTGDSTSTLVATPDVLFKFALSFFRPDMGAIDSQVKAAILANMNAWITPRYLLVPIFLAIFALFKRTLPTRIRLIALLSLTQILPFFIYDGNIRYAMFGWTLLVPFTAGILGYYLKTTPYSRIRMRCQKQWDHFLYSIRTKT